MKEIDFLPEWYKEGKRRKVSTRRQCLVLGLIVAAMVGYNTFTAHKINCATAELEQLEDHRAEAERITRRFDKLSRAIAEYQAEVDLLSRMDSRIDSAAVIAELSHIIGEHAVISRVEFTAEPVAGHGQAQRRPGTAVRAAAPRHGARQTAPLGGVKFRILLAGVAAKPQDVAELVDRLGKSSYFRDVDPSGFRTTAIDVPTKGARGADSKAKIEVSDFTITCYLANYDEIQSE